MAEKKTKLLLLSSYGGGHWRAAEAIREAFTIRHSHVEAELINFMEYAHPLLQRRKGHPFLGVLRRFPYVYRYAFFGTHSLNLFTLRQWVALAAFRRILTLLENTNPSAVVSTHPFPAGVISTFKGYGWTSVPTITVITDHTDHHSWLAPHTDHYLVGSDDVRKKLIAKGIPEEKVTVTGIPIRPPFSLPHSRSEARLKYGLKADVPTLLIMGGSWGLIEDGVEILRLLDRLPTPLQIIFVCGKNSKLQDDLLKEKPNLKNEVIVTPYINDVDQAMAASDLIITKAGGITTTEAIASEVPLLLYKPLPGQEEENVRFLLNAGVALLATEVNDLANQVEALLKEPEKLRAMRERERLFSFKNSSFLASDLILSLIQPGAGREGEG